MSREKQKKEKGKTPSLCPKSRNVSQYKKVGIAENFQL